MRSTPLMVMRRILVHQVARIEFCPPPDMTRVLVDDAAHIGPPAAAAVICPGPPFRRQEGLFKDGGQPSVALLGKTQVRPTGKG